MRAQVPRRSGYAFLLPSLLFHPLTCSPAPQRRARGAVGEPYFFFCLTCRLPKFFMLFSVITLFVVVVALVYPVWPGASLAVVSIAGTLLTLQYLVYGAQSCVELVVRLVGRVSPRRAGGVAAPPASVDAPPQTSTVQTAAVVFSPNDSEHPFPVPSASAGYIPNHNPSHVVLLMQGERSEDVSVEMSVLNPSPTAAPDSERLRSG